MAFQELATWATFSHTIDLPATDKRTAHQAKVAISFGQVTLKKGESANKLHTPATHQTWVVYAKELPETVVGNEEPIEWILYTSHPVLTLADALQIIGWYKERWNIEQLFRTLLNPTVEGKTEKSKNPYNKDSLAFAVWVVARLAGWSGCQKQRPPGPIDCLNGMKILNQQYKGYQLAKDKLTKDVYIP